LGEQSTTASVERLGLGGMALGAIERRQVVQRRADLRVVGAQRLFGDRQRALQERPIDSKQCVHKSRWRR